MERNTLALGLHRRRDQTSDLTAEENDDNLDKIEAAIAAAGGGPGAPVVSVNGHTGAVDLDASDVGAAPTGHSHSAAVGPSTPGFMTGADKAKLDGIAPAATANAPNATLLARANHTGEQAISTITDLQNQLNGKAAIGALPADHSVTLTKLAQSGASVGQVPIWNGTDYAPGTPTAGGQTIYVKPEEQAGATTEDKLNAAIASAISLGRPLLLSAVYSITSALTTVSLTDGQTLHVVGDGSIVTAANVTNPLVIQATWPSAVSISAISNTTHTFPGDSITASDCTKITAAGHGCAIGDIIKIVADDAIPGSTLGPSSAIRRVGEFAYVADVSGNDLYLAGVLIDTYTTARRLVKVPQKAKLIWDGPNFDATAGQSWGVVNMVARGLFRPFVSASFRNGYHTGLQLQSCFQAEIDIDGSKFLNRVSSLGIAGYVVQDIGSYQTKGIADAMDARHAYTTGSNSTASGGGAAYLNGRTVGARVRGAAIGCTSSAYDVHSEAIDCVFDAVTITGGTFGEDSNGSGVQMRGRGNKSIGATVRNSPHGAQFYAQVAGDCWDCLAKDLDYVGVGDAIRFGGAGSSIRPKRCVVRGGIFRVDNTRAIYIDNAEGVVIEDVRIALTGSQTSPNAIILDGDSSATLINSTLDLTDFTGTTVDFAAFSAASPNNVLTVINPKVIDPNGKLRSWFNGADTSGVVILQDVPPDAVLSGDPIINGDSLTASTISYKLIDGEAIKDSLLSGAVPDVTARVSEIREYGATVVTLPKGRAITTHPDTGEMVFPTAADMRDSFLGLPALYEIKTGIPIEIATQANNLAAAHDRQNLRFTHATPTLTVLPQSTGLYPAGMLLAGTSLNALTITPGAGVTINGVSTSFTIAPETLASGFSLRRNLAADSWTLVAGLALPDAPAYTAPTATVSAILDLLEATNNGTNKARVSPAVNMVADALLTLPGVSGTLALLSQVAQLGATGVLTAGHSVTPPAAATKTSGTFTPDIAAGYIQPITNDGAHTIGVPTWYGSMILEYTNNGSAGALTTTGWKVEGDTFTTTNGAIHHIQLIVTPAYARMIVRLKP